MKVLHVHRIANVPSVLVKYLKRAGVDCDLVEDPKDIVASDYDIVHGHYAVNRNTLASFKKARKAGVPFILHCHGSDVRRLTGSGPVPVPAPYSMLTKYMQKRSSKILLSTPDLVDFSKGEYIPNPIDTEHFRPHPEVERTDRILIAGRQFSAKVLDHIEDGRGYDCINTGKELAFPENVSMFNTVSYEDLPRFLCRYEQMIASLDDPVTVTRLGAMACGLRTFSGFDERYSKYYDGLNPDKAKNPISFIKRFHDPEKIVSHLIEIYEGLCRK